MVHFLCQILCNHQSQSRWTCLSICIARFHILRLHTEKAKPYMSAEAVMPNQPHYILALRGHTLPRLQILIEN